jgi:hypothetical protein
MFKKQTINQALSDIRNYQQYLVNPEEKEEEKLYVLDKRTIEERNYESIDKRLNSIENLLLTLVDNVAWKKQ